MIPRRIDRRADIADNYTQLAEYIAAAGEEGEKLDRFWIVNCKAGTELADLKLALCEIEAKRTLRSDIADKTYHLVVSFRPGEEKKLSADDLKDIERHFAEALGYGEHQRVAGTHVNTDNVHMHIAFNKVHPGTLRIHTPRRDFFALEKAARAMEEKYGLYVDKGASESQEVRGDKARAFEAKTWQQSFESHLKEHKVEILAGIAGAKSWREVHKAVAPFDAQLRKRGAGLVFRQIDGRWTMKASTLDRSCSLKALEERFGPFEPARTLQEERRPAPTHPYIAKPTVRHPGQERLWRLYRGERKAPGFLARNVFNLRSWKDYLLADAHKDMLALAIIITYKEALHLLEGSPRPASAPKSITPALRGWFASLPWEAPDTALPLPAWLPGAGLKVDGEGKVLFAMRDADGRVWAIRAVDEQGRTCDLGDMSARPALRHVIDRRKRLAPGSTWAGTIVLGTSCTAAVAIHKATGLPVVVAARERDLPDLARELRRQKPNNPIIIAALENSRVAAKASRLVGGRATTSEALIAEAPEPERVLRALARKITQAASSGRPVSVDADIAEAMAAFLEEALPLDPALATPAGVRQMATGSDQAKEDLRATIQRICEEVSTGGPISVDRELAEAMGALIKDAFAPKCAAALSNHDKTENRHEVGPAAARNEIIGPLN